MGLTREEAHKFVDLLFDEGAKAPIEVDMNPEESSAEVPKRELPDGKRVVRTKSSGDRVYLLDDVKKTRQWVTNPEVLKGAGFEIEDVVEVEDSELLKYQMSSALYKID